MLIPELLYDHRLGVRFRPIIQGRSEGAASLSGDLSDSSGSKSTVGSTRRRSTASATRRLRFEDETETEAESRYLERQRQRRQAGKRAPGVLVSKPDLNLYVNSRAGLRGSGHFVDRQHEGGIAGVDRCDSSGTVLRGGVNLNLHLHPTPHLVEDPEQSLYWPHLNLRTEPIKETYIGSLKPTDICRGGGAWGAPNMQVKRRTNQVELNGNKALPISDLPINPYADLLVSPTVQHNSVLTPATSRCTSSSTPPPVTSTMRPHSVSLNNMMTDQNQNQEEEGRPAAAEPNRHLPSLGEMKERSPCVAPTTQNSSSSETDGQNKIILELTCTLTYKHTSTLTCTCTYALKSFGFFTAESQTPPTSENSTDGHVRQPMSIQPHNDLTTLPEQ